jgi:uncharacterized protein (TIGR00369 family)
VADVRRLNPEHVRAVANLVNHSPYFSLLSMEVLDLSMGTAHLKIAVHEKHLQPFGMVHGGVYASLIDAAAFWACYCQVEEGLALTTVEMKLNYLAPTSKGVLIGKGRSIKMGKTLCLADAVIEDEQGRILAHGTATMMVLESIQMEGQTGLPRKFLSPSI